MWPFEDELTDWFEQVNAARKNGWDGPGRGGDGDDEDRPMMQNEYARQLRRR